MIAPEKTDTLLKLLREIKLYPKTAAFRFSTFGTYLHISEGALNLIWCASYASWFIYQAFANPGENVRFDDDPSTAEAVNLYEWAIKAV